MEWTNSAKASSSKTCLGCCGFGWIERIFSSAKVSPAISCGAGLVATALVELVGFTAGLGRLRFADLAGAFFVGTLLGAFLAAGLLAGWVRFFPVSRETSGISAPRPRPRLFRCAILFTLSSTFSDFFRCC